MTKYPKYLQDSENSCGVYCIKMLLNYYHFDDEIKNIKNKCRLTKDGTTVYGLIRALQYYHIEAKAYQCEFKDLYDHLKVPAIVHMKNDNIYHYIVLYKMHDEYFLVGDPAKGLVKMSYEAFHEQFTGVVIMIEHVGHPLETSSYSFLSFIKDHIKDYKKDMIPLMIKTLFISFLTLIFSLYYQIIIDKLSSSSMMMIILITLAFMAVYFIRAILEYYRRLDIIDLKLSFNERYVIKTMQNLIYQDLSFFSRYDEGIILSRSNQLLDLNHYFIELYHIFMNLILLVTILLFLLYIHIFLFLLCFIFVVSFICIFVYYQDKIHQYNKKLLEFKEKLDDGILEYQDNFFHTIQFQLKRTMKNKMAYYFDDYFQKEYDKGYMMSAYSMSIETMIQVMMMVTTVIAMYFYHIDHLTLGTVILVYMLVSYMVDPLMNIASFMVMNDEIHIIFERYKELLPDKKQRKKRIKKIRTIELKDVQFSYGYQKPVFEHLSFLVDHSFVLDGDVGSGKSTFLKIVSGQLDLLSGNMLVNGKDIDDIDKNSLFSRIKYLDKNPVFYKESLLFNLILDRKEKEDQMYELLYTFNLESLIPCLHYSLDTKGGFLSSGQAQLVMIIRALLNDIDLLILDEAFSNVDKKRRTLLLSYLEKTDITIIIVSHQIKVMNKNYDYVIMETGKLKREGKHGNRFSFDQ